VQALLPVLRKVGIKNADPARLTELPLAAGAMWAFYAGAAFCTIGLCAAPISAGLCFFALHPEQFNSPRFVVN
jgi:hypothetical protein